MVWRDPREHKCGKDARGCNAPEFHCSISTSCEKPCLLQLEICFGRAFSVAMGTRNGFLWQILNLRWWLSINVEHSLYGQIEAEKLTLSMRRGS